ncbi:MAG: SMP-30/gluconolactonase/LRE family protein [Gemmatimonadetes bacterium]|nr:SMP-30/gluconolactonase/LRE family protein [Gemmatimonadota bacterium]
MNSQLRGAVVSLLIAVACARGDRATGGAPGPITVADVGFQTPESALHDPTADVYLVTNINGNPLEKDDNGFVSHVGPDGTLHALKWIDGASPTVTLHAPKGMALKGDTLFVADIDALRMFDRRTGAPLGERAVPGASFLNDVTVGPDGTLYVTDSGLRPGPAGFEPSGSDAVHHVRAAGTLEVLLADTGLGRPNGVIVDGSTATVVSFGSGAIVEIDVTSGRRTRTFAKPPAGQLDGVVRLADGSLLVSSWEGRAVYRTRGDTYATAVDSVEAPADIGYDAGRGRVLIPLFTTNRLEIRTVR